ncbi:MAG: glycosyltransferase, partial [Candidatus Omnitrophica bacterium]|nr:glycosyltransferase [Candidatus Omnitrophota bacterium]
MKILNISNMPIWLWGKGKGIPSIFFPQREFARKGFAACFLCPIKSGEKAYEVNEGVFIHRFDFPFNFKKNRYVQDNSFIDRIRGSLLSNLNWLFFQVAGLIKGLEIGLKFRPDIIYAHSLTSVFPAFILSRVLSSKLIIRVYGTRQLYWLWDNLWYRVKECRDYLAFRVPADYFIITNDGNMGNLLAKKMGVPDEKIKYWRNGIDDNFLSADADAKENICKELDIPLASKIIASTCRLIPDYGVEDMLKSLITVLNKNKDVVCIISGSGPEE